MQQDNYPVKMGVDSDLGCTVSVMNSFKRKQVIIQFHLYKFKWTLLIMQKNHIFYEGKNNTGLIFITKNKGREENAAELLMMAEQI